MEDLPELPPLPMGEDWEYTPEEMREYARKAVLAERERIAKWYEAEGWLLDESNVAAAIRSSGGN